MSLVCYAVDVLNLSRSLQRVSDVFSILEAEYLQLGLHFNSSKSEIVLFNWKSDLINSVKPENSLVQPVDHLVYLGLPIGSSIRLTQYLLIEHVTCSISASSACFNYLLQVQIQPAFAS